jgi:phosphoglycolate phosphatase-like HAD superfamily hydrolase
VTLLEDFRRLRPYVRAGEDFILIQKLIATNTPIHSQQQFDGKLADLGEQEIARYADAFYAARRSFLMKHRGYWISLNRLYPHVYPCLIRWSSSPYLYILSTKKAQYIGEILTAKGITFDPGRILSCGAKEKKAVILRTLDTRRLEQALFVDDQIDHLAPDRARDPRILGLLASWGYVQQQWLHNPRGIEVLQPEQLADRIGPLLDS